MKISNQSSTVRLLSLPEVASMLGVCQRTILREVQRGGFPRPVRIGRAVRFVKDEIDGYLSRKLQRR